MGGGGIVCLGFPRPTHRFTPGEAEKRLDCLLVGVAEDEECTSLRHGNSLLFQLNVRKWPRPWTNRHFRLILILISYGGDEGGQ